MKKIIIVLVVFLNMALFSCTPTDETFLESEQTEATQGENGEILPDEEQDNGDEEDIE